jgi:hypothetical protein
VIGSLEGDLNYLPSAQKLRYCLLLVRHPNANAIQTALWLYSQCGLARQLSSKEQTCS